MLDCNKCAWKHPETCRACRQEQEQEQASSHNEIEWLRKLLEDATNGETWVFPNATEAQIALSGIRGEMSEEYQVDGPEYTDPRFKHQN